MSAKKPKTTPILDGAYLVVGIVPGLCGTKLGMVDLSKINAAKAEQLLAIGFPYLRKAPAKAEPAKTTRRRTDKKDSNE
ncbi:hypothetical protein [Mongoliibacter ruber]|uniref:Uncharacterized protein n=1 Tax=Mongoliibacter ruber TaxID=1750599 RepID=A0A2T0WV80_9BACT|nr:hypothetical protein [Mongoliibacter ruber]PRY90587.1 hypothetical protein CLW00_101251 [Mongoliibacter ruber]